MSRLRYLFEIPESYLLILSAFGYLVIAIVFPLPPNYDLQPVGDIRTFLPGTSGGLLYGLLLMGLFSCHWLIYRRARIRRSWTLRKILSISVLFSIPLLFTYPINANDVYRYVIRGLISSQFGLSPYIVTPADTGEDLFIMLAGEWAEATSPYGPLWEMVASAVTTIGQDDLLLNLVLFKALGTLSLIGASLLLWNLFSFERVDQAPEIGRRASFTILWAWNPALLLTFVANAHNDALMILVLLLGWWIAKKGYWGPGFLVMVAGALVKPVAILALPVAFVSAWRELDTIESRGRFAIWATAGGLTAALLSFLPFGDPLRLLLRLLQEASAGASFSPITLTILLAREIGWQTLSIEVLMRVATLFFAAFTAWVLWRTWRGGSPERSIAALFWAYVFQALNFRIWYAVWPFPWLLLDAANGEKRAQYFLHAGLWFLVTSQLSVIVYGHLRTGFLGSDHLPAHLIGVPFVFLLPFVLALFTFARPNSMAGNDRRSTPERR